MGLLILLCGFQSISAYGQVVATWTGGSGNWSNAANWSSNPSEPINGADSATIATPGSSVVFDIPYASINSLTLGTTDSLSIKAAKYLQVESTVNSGVFANNGYFSVASSSSGFSNYGTVLNAPGATFEQSWIVYNYGNFTNSGQLKIDATFYNYGTFTNYGNVPLYTFKGDMENYGAFTNYGTFNDCCGSINHAGGTITNYGVIVNTVFSFSNNGVLNNNGAINNAATMNNATGANFTNFGTVTTTGTINNSGNFTNFGAVTISNSGLFTTSTNYTQTAGSTLVNGTLTATGSAIVNIQGGVLGGTGTIIGNVAMGGTLTPGAPGTPGTLTIVGNYEQLGNGTLEELIGPVSSSLNVIGGVALDSGASLDIALLNGYDPLGQTFDIMNYDSLIGQFSNGSSFWDDGYLWDVSYGQNQIDVRAVQVPEPSSLSLVLIGLAALAFCAHRSRINTQHLA